MMINRNLQRVQTIVLRFTSLWWLQTRLRSHIQLLRLD